jgi:hypothetical protein
MAGDSSTGGGGAQQVLRTAQNVHPIRDDPIITGSGGGGSGGDRMEARLTKVEDSLAATREDISSIKATLEHLSTKADVAKLSSDFHESHVSLLKWLVGTVIACGALAFAIARYIH